MQKYVDDATKARKRRDLTAEIDERERSIVRLAQQQEAEVTRLRQDRSRANNNLAGATWEQSLATEMSAVAERYRTRIEIEQVAITRLSAQLSSLDR